MLVPFKFNSLNIKISHLGFNKSGVFRKYNDYRRLPFYVRPRVLVPRQEQQMTITCQISGNYIHKRLSSCNSSLIKWCTQLIMYLPSWPFKKFWQKTGWLLLQTYSADEVFGALRNWFPLLVNCYLGFWFWINFCCNIYITKD